MTDFPEGAIRSRKEFEALVGRAKQGEIIHIYPVFPEAENGPAVGLNRVWDKASYLDSYANYTDTTDGQPCHLELREILGFGLRRLFLNYWLAWAYVLKLKNRP